MKDTYLADAKQAILAYNKDKAVEIVEKALADGVAPAELLEEGFIPGIVEVGNRFEAEEIFLPELMFAAETMKVAAEACNKAIPEGEAKKAGVIVLGTVKGDLHDIGKNIVNSFLSANGFEVHDLGCDVPASDFIEKAKEFNADIIATSALLTTTMEAQMELEEELKNAGIRDQVKTIVGGAPVDQGWADKIGANAYAEDAASAVHKINELLAA